MGSYVKIEAILLDHQILSVWLLVHMYVDLLANFVCPLGVLYLYNVLPVFVLCELMAITLCVRDTSDLIGCFITCMLRAVDYKGHCDIIH